MNTLLTRTEELILLSVWRLQKEAYGLSIKKGLADLLGKEPSVGAVYVPLERMVKNGFLTTRESDPTDKRGGRRKRFYELTAKGRSALVAVRTVHEKAWAGISELAVNRV